MLEQLYRDESFAVWRGPPSPERIEWIPALTKTDSEGRRYWRKNLADGWRKLRITEDFAGLNRAVDRLSPLGRGEDVVR